MVSSEVQHRVSQRAMDRCEYCQMHQSLQGATFHLEHAVPRSAGGTDELDNLALACPSCNLHKADRTKIQVAGFEEFVALFNPRINRWPDHFQWDDYLIVGKTDIGHATIIALDLNHGRRLKIRRAEQLFELFPPDPT